MIVKKNFISMAVPMLWFVPMVFLLPFLLVYTFQSSWAAIVPVLVCLLLAAVGSINIVQFIRFRNKLMVIGPNDVTFCLWRLKKIAWTDIKDIRLETILVSEYIVIQTNLCKMTISLDNKQLGISSDEIYSYMLEKWVAANQEESAMDGVSKM